MMMTWMVWLAAGAMTFGAAINAFAATPTVPAVSPPGFAVVELFTSEGCSSCPPADAQASRLISDAEKAGKPVYVLAFHVDYWDYLGWKDPFSQAAFSQRQRAYAKALHSEVYTPQMVVNGMTEFVGSDHAAAQTAIAAALEKKASSELTLTVTPKDHALQVDAAIANAPKGAVVRIALVQQGLAVDVQRGENAGRKLSHENVVRIFETLTPDAAGKCNITLQVPADVDLKQSHVIAFVQDPTTLAISAAAEK